MVNYAVVYIRLYLFETFVIQECCRQFELSRANTCRKVAQT
jgi:hypothetical protein